MPRYLSAARVGEAEIEEKRSVFRCRVEPVASEAEARAVVAAARQRHWDARHHCSAFVIGPDAALQRSSDDGEPAGTAGAPMLEVLRGQEVSDVVAVVTRWFGGVLLGAGGLVRAYGDATRAGLEAAGTRQRVLVAEYAVEVDHAAAGRVDNELRHRGAAIGLQMLDAQYAARARLLLGVPSSAEVDLIALVAAVTGGDTPTRLGDRWADA